VTAIRALVAGFLLAMSGVVIAGNVGLRRTEANVHEFTLLVEFIEGGHCSATKVGRSTILLAAHCLSPGMTAVLIEKTPVAITAIDEGPGDQARLTLRAEFKRWAFIGRPPKQGDEVFMFGNPAHHRDQLRRGYIAGTRDDGLITAMLPLWKGDSGSAVFNDRGQIVALVVQWDVNEYYTVAILHPVKR
jgi:hypothetical protein